MTKHIGNRIGIAATVGTGGLWNIYNQFFYQKQGTWPVPPPPLSGLTATGGVISDYTSGPAVYRAHIFTSTGTFTISALGDYGSNVEYLVVAGGGGGGSSFGGAGGAGGLRTNLSGHPLAGSAFPVSTSPGSYTVTIGGGGSGAEGPQPSIASNGVNSSFGPTITSTGGGCGGSNFGPAKNGIAGGSGGSGGLSGGAGSPGSGNTPPTSPPQGNAGGTSDDAGTFPGNCTGGGGGAGGAGGNASASVGGVGGAGVQVAIAGPPTTSGVGALNPGPGEYQWFAGGGGGHSGTGQSRRSGGAGGGGQGGINLLGPGANKTGLPATYSTGGGGGASGGNDPSAGGNGGSGIVVVRYQIGSLTATAKATGGLISFFSGKTIHTFLSSGTFATAPNWTSSPVEYVVIAGAGGGGNGGGGAGGYRTGTTPIGAHPVSTTIQVGGGGVADFISTPINFATSGTPSYFGAPLASSGGGGGGSGGPLIGVPGGSGGGNSTINTPTIAAGNAGSYSPPEGNPGGQGVNAGSQPGNSGGGGGGAGAAGGNASSGAGGPGGVGVQLPSTFRNPQSNTSLGTPGPGGSYYFAGGGAGYSGTTQGSPGAGGGGAVKTTGVENTGGGGGAYGGPPNPPSNPSGPSASGGSGIVIIAYPS
jgi:hypothetical protein